VGTEQCKNGPHMPPFTPMPFSYRITLAYEPYDAVAVHA
jgi:hypothetical protein